MGIHVKARGLGLVLIIFACLFLSTQANWLDETADTEIISPTLTKTSNYLQHTSRFIKRDVLPRRSSINKNRGNAPVKTTTNLNETIDKRISETINMLLEGESQIVLTDSDQVVIILGISGSGKSTLLQFLTGDNEKLIATKVRNVMIIKDTNNKIGSTTKSHTKIPELAVDQFGNHFYDCPGFKDTNDAIYDIASGYFIKKVFDNAKKIKVLLTISFTKVIHGNDRAGFVSLAEQIFELFPNIDKFNESIALIVTKVDRMIDTYDENDLPIFLSDEDKIYDIAGFLESVKTDYEDLVNLKGREKVHKMISLVDILLTTEGERFTRIGLFNRPYKEGPLSADTALQQSKQALQNIINNNLQFTRKENADAQYSISDNSKLYLKNFNEAVISSINNKKIGLIKYIATSYLHSYDDISKVSQFQNDLLSIISNFSNNNPNTSNENYIEMYVKLRNVLQTMKNFDADKDILQILNLIKFLNIMKTFSPGDSNHKLSAQINEFSGMAKFVESLQTWYTFTDEFEAYLAQYDIQISKSSHRQKYNLNNVTSDSTKITTFFQNIPQRFSHAKKAFDFIVNTEPKFTDFLCQQLNEILSYTLDDSNLTVEIKDQEIFISGEFVKLTDTRKFLEGKDFKFINILAFSKIFIDVSVIATQGKHLSIISPVWEVVSKNEIKLQGKDGETFKFQARNGILPGEGGSDGQHGTTGYASGNFIGIGDEIINGKLLHIITQGGQGGSGQKGGDGAPGKIGKESPHWITVLSNQCQYGSHKSPQKFSEIAHQFGCDQTPYDKSRLFLVIVNDLNYYRTCTLYGSDGSDGGNGGNGGNAASGGAAGKILLKFNKNGSSVKETQLEGQTGNKGQAGSGGKAGNQKYHKFKSLEENVYWIIDLIKKYRFCFHDIQYDHMIRRYSSGKIGRPGNVIINQNQENKIDNLPDILNKYKTLAYPKIIKGRNKNLLMEFSIFKDNELNSYLTLVDYATELLGLEQIDNNYKQNSNINLFCNFLAAKVNLLTPKNSDEIKLQGLINAIIMSQSYVSNVQRLKHVADINTFNTFIKEKIKLYEKSDIKRLKSEMTLKFRDHFEKQIKEAQNLIEININDEFANYESSYESNFDLALKECLELQNETSSDVKKLLQKEKLIEEKLTTLQMFSPLKSILKAVQFFSSIIPYVKEALQLTGVASDNLLKVNNLHEFLNETIEHVSSRTETDAIEQFVDDYNMEDKFLEHELSNVKTIISAKKLKLEELQDYQNNIHEFLKPCLSNIKNEVLIFEQNMASNSRAVLNVKSWEVKKNLNLIQDIITKFTQGYKIEIKFIKMIHDLKNSIELIIKLYDQIQVYSEEQNLYQYISSISSIQHKTMIFSDEKYNNIATQLENTIHSNMIMSLYLQLVATVKQYVFPYAESYTHFEHLDIKSKDKTLREKANFAIKQITLISDELTRKTATIVSGQDKDIFTGDFHSKFMISEPFYAWTDSLYQKELERFLSGDEITLKSNIQALHTKNAVKFTYIELNIKAKTSERQRMLDLILSRYIVRMKHPGNSYYKCDSNYFVINSESQVFEYSYEKQNNTTPVYQNEVYRKTATGDLLLSPYTEWRFQLIDKKSNGFNELQEFIGEVSLDLIGTGQYIRDNVLICDSNLEQFYTKFDDKDEKFEVAIQHLNEGLELTSDDLYITSEE